MLYTMSRQDAEIIQRFAAGEPALRQQAIAIHRRHIPGLGVRGTAEQRYGDSYRATDLAAAIASGNEILLSGRYRAIRSMG